MAQGHIPNSSSQKHLLRDADGRAGMDQSSVLKMGTSDVIILCRGNTYTHTHLLGPVAKFWITNSGIENTLICDGLSFF